MRNWWWSDGDRPFFGERARWRSVWREKMGHQGEGREGREGGRERERERVEEKGASDL